MLAMTSEGEWVCDQSYVIYLQLQTTDTRVTHWYQLKPSEG